MDFKNSHVYAAYKRLTLELKTYRLNMSGWKKIFHANGNEKKPGIAKLVSDEVYFKMKSVTRQRRAIYINKGINTSKGYTFVNIYVPNIRIAKYIKQILTNINGEIDSNTIIVGKFKTSLTPMDRSSKMKINKETEALNATLNKMDSIDIYRTFHPKKQNTLLKCSWNLLQDRDRKSTRLNSSH